MAGIKKESSLSNNVLPNIDNVLSSKLKSIKENGTTKAN